MKIVVAISKIDDALFVCEASQSSCKANPNAEIPGILIKDKDIHDFMLSKFPLSTEHWTHIDLEIDL